MSRVSRPRQRWPIICSTAADIPRIEIHHRETPSPHTLGGFKGMGEGGAVNPPAAIANAVTDALSAFESASITCRLPRSGSR